MGKDGNVWKVLRVLGKAQADTGWLWVGQIARLTGLHHETVRRIVNGELRCAIEKFDAEPLISQGLRIRPFRLREEVTAQSHWRWLKAMGKL